MLFILITKQFIASLVRKQEYEQKPSITKGFNSLNLLLIYFILMIQSATFA